MLKKSCCAKKTDQRQQIDTVLHTEDLRLPESLQQQVVLFSQGNSDRLFLLWKCFNDSLGHLRTNNKRKKLFVGFIILQGHKQDMAAMRRYFL